MSLETTIRIRIIKIIKIKIIKITVKKEKHKIQSLSSSVLDYADGKCSLLKTCTVISGLGREIIMQ